MEFIALLMFASFGLLFANELDRPRD